MEIHVIEHGKNMWVKGCVLDHGKQYPFTAKVWDKLSNVYGIGGGRVIKLSLFEQLAPPKILCSYDRGWDRPPQADSIREIVSALTGYLNNLLLSGEDVTTNRPVLLDGKETAREIKERLRAEIDPQNPPTLAVVLVGEDPASQVYVRNKAKDCQECGILCETYTMVEHTDEETLLDMIDNLNRDPAVDGILVQLPLPKHIDEAKVLERIDPRKDVDCFHPVNVGHLHQGKGNGVQPCTPAGIMELLKKYGIDPAGKHAVVVGRSNIVGRPMAELLLQADATVTICHSKTQDLQDICRQADILILAVGKPGFITADMVKLGAVVVDVGMNRNKEGKLCGDVDFDSVTERASFITPVPGGVGPMTRAMLMNNTFIAHRSSYSN